MSGKLKLVSAGNLEAPCYKIIKDLGFIIKYSEDMWIAENEDIIIKGYSQLELLGLITLYSKKGRNWEVDDNTIDEFLSFNK
jgi:hypothetical protein